jgi:hypothetical protein
VLNGYMIALIQLGSILTEPKKIHFTAFSIWAAVASRFFTHSDKCLGSLMPVTVQLLSSKTKKHMKQKINSFSTLTVNNLFLSTKKWRMTYFDPCLCDEVSRLMCTKFFISNFSSICKEENKVFTRTSILFIIH